MMFKIKIEKYLSGAKSHRVCSFPGIILLIILEFLVLASVFNEIKNRHKHQKRDGQVSAWGAGLRGRRLLSDLGHLLHQCAVALEGG